jgi:short-subunit dehydrogenase
MWKFDENLHLKLIAWFLQYPFYILWFIIKFFLNKKTNRWDTIQAPQNPRTIVITGASQGLFISSHKIDFFCISIARSGIGEGLVEYYYKNCPSCTTIILISRSKEKLDEVKNRLDSDKQKKLVIYPCDVTDSDAIKRVLLDVYRIYGQVDILVANAGVSFRQLSSTNTFDKALRDTFNININGVINTVMPLIEVNGVRQIGIVSSQAAYAPFMSPIYGATKQCVLSLGRDLRRLLAKDNVAVNVISPGPVRTPMLVGVNPRAATSSVSMEESSRIIYHGLLQNHAEIVYPAATGIFQYTLSFLPLCIAEPIAHYVFFNR